MTILSVETDLTEFRFGTQSLKITTGNTGNNALYPAVDSIVVPGLPYTFSCYVKTAAPITGGSIYLQIAAGGTITPALFQSEPVTDSSTYPDIVDGWHRMMVSFVAGEGVQLVRPVIRYTGTTLGLIFWLDGIKFEPGLVASTWMQNIVSKQLVLDQGAVQVDASEGGLLRLRGSNGGPRDTITLGNSGLLFGGDVEVLSNASGVLRVAGHMYLPAGAHYRIQEGPILRGADSRITVPASTVTVLWTWANNNDVSVEQQPAMFLVSGTPQAGNDTSWADIVLVISRTDGLYNAFTVVSSLQTGSPGTRTYSIDGSTGSFKLSITTASYVRWSMIHGYAAYR
jgi:hypothetical protein